MTASDDPDRVMIQIKWWWSSSDDLDRVMIQIQSSDVDLDWEMIQIQWWCSMMIQIQWIWLEGEDDLKTHKTQDADDEMIQFI